MSAQLLHRHFREARDTFLSLSLSIISSAGEIKRKFVIFCITRSAGCEGKARRVASERFDFIHPPLLPLPLPLPHE